jgi:hypothetical protein
MFIKGHFIGVVLLSTGIAEFILADQSRLKSQRYRGSGLNHSHLNAGPSLYSFGEGDIEKGAFCHLLLIRYLTVKFCSGKS